MPLQYDKSRAVIIAASSPNRLAEELRAYNIDPASPGLHVMYAPVDSPAVLELPTDTPWTILGDVGPGVKDALTRRFGKSITFPRAIAAYEADVAWAHARYPSPGPAPTYNTPPEPVGPFPHTLPRPPTPVPDGFDAVVTAGNVFVITADNKYVVSPS